MAGRIASQPIMVAHWIAPRMRSTATPRPTRLKAGEAGEVTTSVASVVSPESGSKTTTDDSQNSSAFT